MEWNEELEEKVKEKAVWYLKKGRPEWDLPHTLECVRWMKKLIKAEGGNPKTLLPAIYFHDVGYSGLFDEEDYDLDGIIDVKELHMKRGAHIARDVLEGMNEFTPDEVDRVTHLVRIHDKLDEIEETDEQLVFEADCLGMLSADEAGHNFSEEDFQRFLNFFREERLPRFKTETGKKHAKELLRRVEQERE